MVFSLRWLAPKVEGVHYLLRVTYAMLYSESDANSVGSSTLLQFLRVARTGLGEKTMGQPIFKYQQPSQGQPVGHLSSSRNESTTAL
jgi:hypothetical protein